MTHTLQRYLSLGFFCTFFVGGDSGGVFFWCYWLSVCFWFFFCFGLDFFGNKISFVVEIKMNVLCH